MFFGIFNNVMFAFFATFITKNRNEVLDIIPVSVELIDSIVSWTVFNDHSFARHRCIDLKITEKSPSIKKVVNVRKTNLGYFNRYIVKNLGPALIQPLTNSWIIWLTPLY